MFSVLELNDQSLRIRAAEGLPVQEPGFARLGPEGIETGEAARAVAWREPQHSFNQYWCQLNQNPLPGGHKWARHHADIAFAQLRNLWQAAEKPRSLILLLPGSFSDAQVSLLLGMVKALPAEPIAVIDNALPSCFEVMRDALFVDMQLHQTVLSVCRFGKNAVRIDDQVIVPDLGMMQIYNRLTRHVSDLLIRSFRYDPLHASESEQHICDRLPGWLEQVSWEKESSFTLKSGQGDLPFILRKEDIRQIVGERMSKIRSVIGDHRDCQLVFSHASRLIPSMFEEFAEAEVIRDLAGIDQALLHHEGFLGQETGVQRLRSLKTEGICPGETSPAPRVATHLLYRNKALPLQMPLSIRIVDDDLQMSSRLDQNAELTLVLRHRTLEVMQHASGLEFSVPENCRPGEAVLVGGHHMQLIEVLDGQA